MPELPEGAPCWADVTLPDLEAGMQFYGELFGWTFEGGSAEYGHYTQARSDGKAVAALAPVAPGQEGAPAAWTLYFASSDIGATARRIREHGGEVLMDPMQVGPFGTMLMARDPSGAAFAVWQPGEHQGFAKQGEPGSFCWAEIATRDVDAVDAFYPAVFPITAKRMGEASEMDYKVFEVGGTMMLGRFPMGADIPADVPAHVEVIFAVEDCDDAAARATKMGGQVTAGPEDSPYGRYAVVKDPQGATFSILDPSRTVGEMPKVEG
ncbi:VOC family protein [Streptomyces sp. B6B3]|uniref:VOC family protein n=1 Tax=Streptomyces sp. B6B3 TaxID=3153570 RepID=UPI00325D1AE5